MILRVLALVVLTAVAGLASAVCLFTYLGLGWYRASLLNPANYGAAFDAWPIWLPAFVLAPLCLVLWYLLLRRRSAP